MKTNETHCCSLDFDSAAWHLITDGGGHIFIYISVHNLFQKKFNRIEHEYVPLPNYIVSV